MIARMIKLLKQVDQYEPNSIELCLTTLDEGGWVGYHIKPGGENYRRQISKKEFYSRLVNAKNIAIVIYTDKDSLTTLWIPSKQSYRLVLQ